MANAECRNCGAELVSEAGSEFSVRAGKILRRSIVYLYCEGGCGAEYLLQQDGTVRTLSSGCADLVALMGQVEVDPLAFFVDPDDEDELARDQHEAIQTYLGKSFSSHGENRGENSGVIKIIISTKIMGWKEGSTLFCLTKNPISVRIIL